MSQAMAGIIATGVVSVSCLLARVSLRRREERLYASFRVRCMAKNTQARAQGAAPHPALNLEDETMVHRNRAIKEGFLYFDDAYRLKTAR